jgi:membrane protein
MVESPVELKFHIKHLPSVLKETYQEWNKDDPWRLSAIVAYYALLSLPGLVVIIINTVGAIWGQDIVSGQLNEEISAAVSPEAAKAIIEMTAETQEGNKSLVATIIGIASLLFGATGVFYHLQISINHIWDIKTDPNAGIKKLLIDRATSFAFILVIGFLLLISFALTALISLLQGLIDQLLPGIMVYLVFVVNELISLGVITALFALLFRFLPDAKVRWKTVWVGAIVTAVLFEIGKFALGLYFGNSDPGSAYGAAGSLILVLLWVSYSCLILFFGAELTWVYARRYGHGIEAKPHAIHLGRHRNRKDEDAAEEE